VATERLALPEGKPAKDVAAAKASRKKAVPQQNYEHSEEELEAADHGD
jgi:hypothetical protein